ncbi:hypothetical protein ACN47E_001736 [Coniothyrium glycines]
MSIFSTDCLTLANIQSNSTILAGIQACQEAANTRYCFPPNGTRICIPAEGIPFYWPVNNYSSNAKVALSWNLTLDSLPFHDNSGNGTQDFTPFMFDSSAVAIPGTQHEKALQMRLVERRTSNDTQPNSLEIHDGPTLILVQTSAWPSAASTAGQATPTVNSYDGMADMEAEANGRALKAGAIVGIVFGVLAVAMAIAYCCCWKGGCCGLGKRGREARMARQQQADFIEEGSEVVPRKEAVVLEKSAESPPRYSP